MDAENRALKLERDELRSQTDEMRSEQAELIAAMSRIKPPLPISRSHEDIGGILDEQVKDIRGAAEASIEGITREKKALVKERNELMQKLSEVAALQMMDEASATKKAAETDAKRAALDAENSALKQMLAEKDSEKQRLESSMREILQGKKESLTRILQETKGDTVEVGIFLAELATQLDDTFKVLIERKITEALTKAVSQGNAKKKAIHEEVRSTRRAVQEAHEVAMEELRLEHGNAMEQMEAGHRQDIDRRRNTIMTERSEIEESHAALSMAVAGAGRRLVAERESVAAERESVASALEEVAKDKQAVTARHAEEIEELEQAHIERKGQLSADHQREQDKMKGDHELFAREQLLEIEGNEKKMTEDIERKRAFMRAEHKADILKMVDAYSEIGDTTVKLDVLSDIEGEVEKMNLAIGAKFEECVQQSIGIGTQVADKLLAISKRLDTYTESAPQLREAADNISRIASSIQGKADSDLETIQKAQGAVAGLSGLLAQREDADRITQECVRVIQGQAGLLNKDLTHIVKLGPALELVQRIKDLTHESSGDNSRALGEVAKASASLLDAQQSMHTQLDEARSNKVLMGSQREELENKNSLIESLGDQLANLEDQLRVQVRTGRQKDDVVTAANAATMGKEEELGLAAKNHADMMESTMQAHATEMASTAQAHATEMASTAQAHAVVMDWTMETHGKVVRARDVAEGKVVEALAAKEQAVAAQAEAELGRGVALAAQAEAKEQALAAQADRGVAEEAQREAEGKAAEAAMTADEVVTKTKEELVGKEAELKKVWKILKH